MSMNNRARKQAKREAARPLSELEKAIQAIDRATEQMNASKDRKPCYCLATKHQLNIYAPNCLNCGKIICSLEGPGPCTFCGKPVLSIEQQQEMVLEMKREKAALAKRLAQEKKQQQTGYVPPKRKAKVSAVPTSGYASKLGGGMTAATGSAGGWMDLQEAATAGGDYATGMTEEEELEEARKLSLAQAHKERLLEYDRTSARRSHVIDQATDFVMPGDRPNLWLTEEEREQQQAKARENLERVTEQAKGFQRAKVMTIDVKNRRVVVENSFQAQESEDEEDEDEAVPEPIDKMDLAKQSTSVSGGNRHGGRGTYALNPLLRLGENPTFIPPPKKKDGQEKNKKQGSTSGKDAAGSKKDGSNGKKDKPTTTANVGDEGKGDDNETKAAGGEADAKPSSAVPSSTRPRVPRLQYDDDHIGAQSVLYTMSEIHSVLASVVEPSCG